MIARVTPPDTRAVSLDDAKVFLKMDEISSDDGVILLLLDAAIEQVEAATGRCLINQTWKQTFSSFPIGDDDWQFYRSKVQSITHIKYYDLSGVLQTVPSTVYEIIQEEPAGIRRKTGQSWPAHDGRADGIEVQYVVGYGNSANDVPAMLRIAAQIVLGWLYTNRGAGEYPRETLQALVASYVVTHAIF